MLTSERVWIENIPTKYRPQCDHIGVRFSDKYFHHKPVKYVWSKVFSLLLKGFWTCAAYLIFGLMQNFKTFGRKVGRNICTILESVSWLVLKKAVGPRYRRCLFAHCQYNVNGWDVLLGDFNMWTVYAWKTSKTDTERPRD